MTREDFAVVFAILKTGSGVASVTAEQAAVYFDLLGDLPLPVLQAAVKQVLLNHEYPTLPPVGIIRKAAIALQSPPAIPGPEAWSLFLAAVRRFGSGRRHRMVKGEMQEYDAGERGLRTLPEPVQHAARCFGWQRLCDTSGEHMGIAERDFLQSYGTLEKRDEQQAIMPPSVKAIAEQAGNNFVLNESTTRSPRELAAWIADKQPQPKGV